MEYQLHRYNQMKQKIEPRPANRGQDPLLSFSCRPCAIASRGLMHWDA